MMARPYYTWHLKNNINADNTLILEVDIEMLEKIKKTMQVNIQDLAISGKYEYLGTVIDNYLKLEELSIIYYSREEEQNNDVLPENESTGQE